MTRFLVDTSCMVAALCHWHQYHQPATREVERRLDGGEDFLVAAPALVEAYAVLTRLPPPNRLSPAAVRVLLATNFMGENVEVVALEADAYSRLLQSAPDRGIAGGSIYDAVIVSCGLAAGANFLLTFNDRQFRYLAVQGIEVVVPV